MPGVAIVASATSSAFRAKRALRVEWDRSGAAQDSWDASIDEARRRAKGKPDTVNKRLRYKLDSSAVAASADRAAAAKSGS